MRFLLGVIFGAVLTILGVYGLDQGTKSEEQRPIVNWDVVDERLTAMSEEIEKAWADFAREITGSG